MPMLGIDTDNDSTFINDCMIQYCARTKLEFTRGRPRKKNDQAWIEQKNGAVVRHLVGYERFEGVAHAKVLARLYAAARLYVNIFQPSFKLKSKERIGSKVKKIYYPPATPAQRLRTHPQIGAEVTARLEKLATDLDPVRLLKIIRDAQAQLAGELVVRGVSEEDELEAFLGSLTRLWHLGEVRPTHKKLARYLLNPDHPVGGSKAKWFEEALGFTKESADDLARQISFDPKTAVQTAVSEHGTKFNQTISITGANGKTIDVTFAWIRNNDGVVRLVTGIPTKR